MGKAGSDGQTIKSLIKKIVATGDENEHNDDDDEDEDDVSTV